MTHICVVKLTIIGSNNGLSPGRRHAVIWTNAGILLFRNLGSNFSEILIEIDTFSSKKMHLKMSSGKWRPFVSASMCLNSCVSLRWNQLCVCSFHVTPFFKIINASDGQIYAIKPNKYMVWLQLVQTSNYFVNFYRVYASTVPAFGTEWNEHNIHKLEAISN